MSQNLSGERPSRERGLVNGTNYSVTKACWHQVGSLSGAVRISNAARSSVECTVTLPYPDVDATNQLAMPE
jgi:hypothetical protein